MKIERIDVKEGNTKFKSIDGVLYDYDLTTLISYPIGNHSTYYISPPTLTTIGTFIFKRADKLEWILFRCNLKTVDFNSNTF